jgi:nucleotide-binding universal stress UspA family protein
MAMFDAILVPIDGSRPSEVGSALATELAQRYGGSLLFVNIVDVGPWVSTTGYDLVDPIALSKEAHDAGEHLVDAAIATARANGLTADGAVLDGPVVDRLLDAVVELEATVVVMGAHGRGGLAGLLKRSTTDGLLRRCPVPVIVAPRGTPRHDEP